ncbi:hypothetical protein SMA90_31200, partial [Escherichia coli]
SASTDALSGSNNRATALSLNACPYLATSSFFRNRPQILDSIEAITILTRRVRQILCRHNLEQQPEALRSLINLRHDSSSIISHLRKSGGSKADGP